MATSRAAAAGAAPTWSDLEMLQKVALNVVDEPTISTWQSFMEEHEAVFAEDRDRPKDEHSLEATQVHSEFVAMVESQLEGYLTRIGSSTEVTRGRRCWPPLPPLPLPP